MLADIDTTEDAALGGRLVLRQPKRGHRFGHDAILLAAAVDARPGEIAVDLGAGVGTAGLALAQRVPGLQVRLVEIDATLADLARENAARNRLADRVSVVSAWTSRQTRNAFERHGMAGVDHVLMNPPFNDPAQCLARCGAAPRACRGCRRARRDGSIARPRLLGPRGTLTLIWRAAGLADVLGALGGGFGGITSCRSIRNPRRRDPHPGPRRPGQRRAAAHAPAAHAQRRGRTPSAQAEAVLRGGMSLPMTA